MRDRSFTAESGFTLIELLIVVTILGSLSVTFYRFAHEGLDKGVAHSREGSTMRDTRIAFRFLEHDLRHASSLPSALGLIKADKETLIVNTLPLAEKARALAQSGAPAKTHTVVYRGNLHGDLVREVYAGGKLSSSLALLGPLTELKFEYGPASLKTAWVRIRVVRKTMDNDMWPLQPLERIFKVS